MTADRLRLRFEAIEVEGSGCFRFHHHNAPRIHWPVPVINPSKGPPECTGLYCIVCLMFTATIPCPFCNFDLRNALERFRTMTLEYCHVCELHEVWNGVWCSNKYCRRTVLLCPFCVKPSYATGRYYGFCTWSNEWRLQGFYCNRDHLYLTCTHCHGPTGTNPCTFCGTEYDVTTIDRSVQRPRWFSEWPTIMHQVLSHSPFATPTMQQFVHVLREYGFIDSYISDRTSPYLPIPLPRPPHTIYLSALPETGSQADTAAETATSVPEVFLLPDEALSLYQWHQDDLRSLPSDDEVVKLPYKQPTDLTEEEWDHHARSLRRFKPYIPPAPLADRDRDLPNFYPTFPRNPSILDYDAYRLASLANSRAPSQAPSHTPSRTPSRATSRAPTHASSRRFNPFGQLSTTGSTKRRREHDGARSSSNVRPRFDPTSHLSSNTGRSFSYAHGSDVRYASWAGGS
eukprot:GHVU01192060.1.p1 GENE.GHVU01192060.1~~GHVU01192060.1.p1  ORF type:complete len:468 (+),score=-3.96 GHVU01192060.1:34-1404(+)